MSNSPYRPSAAITRQPASFSLTAEAGINDSDVVQGTFALNNRIASQIEVWEGKPRTTLISLIKGDPAQKALSDARVEKIGRQLQAQMKAFDLATEAKLALAEAGCETIVRETKVRHGTRLAQMIMASYEQLHSTVHATRETFMAKAAESFENAQKYAHIPFIVDRAVESIENEVNAFHDYLDSTTQEFLARARHRLTEWNQTPGAAANLSSTRPNGSWQF